MDQRDADHEQSVLAVEQLPARADVGPPADPDSGQGGDVFADAVTLVEISPPQVGGITESALPGNRAGSPPPPLAAPRIGWSHRGARWMVYVLVVVALTLLFLWLLVDLFRVG